LNFFEELKRRNVFKVSAAYGVLGWLIIEVVDTIAPRMALPEWVPGFFIILVLVGFPIAAFFAWAFELTPEGVKRTEDVERESSLTGTTGHGINYIIIAALMGVVLWQQFAPRLSDLNPFADARTSEAVTIAVLPFADLSADGDQEYLGDGVAEEILNVLAGVGGLQVTSRTSAFAFKEQNRPIPEIAAALGVGHIVEGSVRKQGDQVRITAQLIEVANDSHLWSETYDSDLTDIFRLQDEIARQISSALSERLDLALPEVEDRVVEWDVAAYELYLRARQALLTRTANEQAVRLAEAAVMIEPDFADAWAVIATARALDAFGLGRDAQSWDAAWATYDEAWIAASRAVAIDPQNSLGVATLGLVKMSQKKWTESRVFLNRAIGVEAPDPNAFLWLGILEIQTGLFDDALTTFDTGLGLHPGDLNLMRWKIDLLALQDRWVEVAGAAEILAPLGDGDSLIGRVAAGLVSGESDVDALVDSWFTLETAGGQSQNTLTRAEITLLMRRLVDPASSAEVTLEELPSLGALVLFRELLGHYAPDLFGALLRDEASMLVAGPNQNSFGFYWAEHVAGVRDAPEFRPLVLDLGLVEYWQLFGWPKVCRPVGPRDFECD
jgi:TolB-like protein